MSGENFFVDTENHAFHYKTKGVLSVEQAENLLSKLIYSTENICGCFLEEDSQDIVLLPSQEDCVDEFVPLLEKMIASVRQMRVLHHRVIKEYAPDHPKNSSL